MHPKTHFKLKEGVSPALVAEKVKSFYNASSLKQTRGPKEYKYALLNIDDIHLKSDYRYELRESSTKINRGKPGAINHTNFG